MTRGRDDRSEDFAALAELAEDFVALVDALTEGATTELRPHTIVELASRTVPSSQHVGLTTWTDGKLTTVAATSDIPGRLDEIRQETGEGPALDALVSNEIVVSGDLPGDLRWPTFGPRATDETGVRSLMSYRLHFGKQHRGALTFCSDWPHAFDDVAVAIGAIFAAYCSLSLLAHLLNNEHVNAEKAGEVHREIGVAVGILMSSGKLRTEDAFEQLRGASRRLRRSLPDVARQVIEEGELPG